MLTYCPLLEEGGVETGGGSWVLGAELVAAFDVTVAVGALFLWFIHWGVACFGILGIPDMSLGLSRSGSSPGGMPMFNSGSPVLEGDFKQLRTSDIFRMHIGRF